MLYLFKLLFILINIDQETVLAWFGIEDFNSHFSNSESFSLFSLKTFQLIFESLWQRVQNGLTLSDIENVLFFILFIRFVILAIRYNLKTSFYITCIGIFAGYLWYRHLIDLIATYQNVLINIPFFNQLGIDAADITELDESNSFWLN